MCVIDKIEEHQGIEAISGISVSQCRSDHNY